MWNLGRKGMPLLKGGMPRDNPVSEVTFEPPDDERDRVFSAEEIARLQDAAPGWLQPVILLADQTGMPRGEIVDLRWDQVDGKRGVIRLRSADTKAGEGRVIPLLGPLMSLFATLPRGLGQTIDEGDLQEAMATLQTYLAHHELDTSMGTVADNGSAMRRKNLVNPRR